MRTTVTLAAMLLLVGCASTGPAPMLTTQCTTPRPQVCTMEYAPVCATRNGGARADYSSACNACADDNVTAYINGRCDGGSSGG